MVGSRLIETGGLRTTRRPLGLALFGLFALLACGDEPADPADSTGAHDGPTPPHVVLISLDTLRADHLSCYGYERPTSPVLDELAEDAYLFENLIAASSSTAPSHTSLFTGVVPRVHGIFNERPALPSPNLPYLPEMLRDAGWRTAAFADGGILTSEYGFARGFEHFDSGYEPFELKLDRVETWLDDAPDDPTFLFVHTYGAHAPYLPAAGHDLFTDPDADSPLAQLTRQLARRRDRGEIDELETMRFQFWSKLDRQGFTDADLEFLVGLYDGAIHGVDAGVGRLLGMLRTKGWFDDAWVIVMSDHGEAFNEHGTLTHRRIHQEELWVPLIIRPPGGREALRIGTRVSHVDLLPTLVELLGLRGHPALQGRSFWPFEELDADRRVMVTGGALRQDAVFEGQYKLILDATAEPSLFALDADPGELTNLVGAPGMRPVVYQLKTFVKQMRSDAAALVERVGEPILDPEALDPARLAELRALGYVK